MSKFNVGDKVRHEGQRDLVGTVRKTEVAFRDDDEVIGIDFPRGFGYMTYPVSVIELVRSVKPKTDTSRLVRFNRLSNSAQMNGVTIGTIGEVLEPHSGSHSFVVRVGEHDINTMVSYVTSLDPPPEKPDPAIELACKIWNDLHDLVEGDRSYIDYELFKKRTGMEGFSALQRHVKLAKKILDGTL